MGYYETNRQAFLEGLKTFLRIPSISTSIENKPDIRRAAEFVRNELQGAGLNHAELIEGEGNPLVYARVAGRAGQADAAVLRPLRRAAARSAGRMEVAAVRAGDPGRGPVRSRGLRRQGADLHPDQSRRGVSEDDGQAAGKREVPGGRRRGSWRGAHHSLRRLQARATSRRTRR